MVWAPDAGSKSDEIAEGAFAVLLGEGLTHLSYDRAARAAGVTRQLVRDYYPQHCDRLADSYREFLIQGVMGRSDQERLTVFFDFYFDLLDGTAKPRDDQVHDALFSLAAGSPRIRSNLRGQYTLLGQALTHELRTSYTATSAVLELIETSEGFGGNDYSVDDISFVATATTAPIPLPATAWILLAGLASLALVRRRRRTA